MIPLFSADCRAALLDDVLRGAQIFLYRIDLFVCHFSFSLFSLRSLRSFSSSLREFFKILRMAA